MPSTQLSIDAFPSSYEPSRAWENCELVSNMDYLNDFRHDLFRHDLASLADIAHKHGAFMVVDAIQSASAMMVGVEEMWTFLPYPSISGFLKPLEPDCC